MTMDAYIFNLANVATENNIPRKQPKYLIIGKLNINSLCSFIRFFIN